MKKQKAVVLSVCLTLIVALLAVIFLVPSDSGGESINDAMRNEVLHETDKINFFGL